MPSLGHFSETLQSFGKRNGGTKLQAGLVEFRLTKDSMVQIPLLFYTSPSHFQIADASKSLGRSCLKWKKEQ